MPRVSALAPAGQRAGLLHPVRELSLVELLVLVDVEIAHVVVLGLAGRERTQCSAAKESDLDVPREAMKVEEPALALDPVERRVPTDCLAHVGDRADDESIEAPADVAFPPRHSGDVSLHGGVAV